MPQAERKPRAAKVHKIPKVKRPPLSGRGRRSKGADYERECANVLATIYPKAKRGLAQTRNGAEVEDVAETPWWVECKSYKAAADVRRALTQATNAALAAGTGKPPVVIARRTDMRPDLVVMALGDWLALVTELESHRTLVAQLRRDGFL